MLEFAISFLTICVPSTMYLSITLPTYFTVSATSHGWHAPRLDARRHLVITILLAKGLGYKSTMTIRAVHTSIHFTALHCTHYVLYHICFPGGCTLLVRCLNGYKIHPL